MVKPFVDIVAESLKIPPEEALIRVNTFCTDILGALSKNGHCLVEGLGEFDSSSERIRFRGADELVNVLKTIAPSYPDYGVATPLPPNMLPDQPAASGVQTEAPKPAPPIPEPDSTRRDAPAPDREATRPVERTPPESSREEPGSQQETEDDAEEPQEWAQDREPIVTRRVSSSLDPEFSTMSQENASASRQESGRKEERTGKSRLPAHKPKKSARTQTATRNHTTENAGRKSLIIVGSAVILILCVVAATQLGLWPMGSEQIDPSPAVSEGTETSSDTLSGGMSTAASNPDSSTVSDTTTVAANEPSQPTTTPESDQAESEDSDMQETPSAYPESYTLDRSMAGYTMIVGSGVTQEEAIQAMTRFTDFGLPYGVLVYEESGRTRYRLGLGQYTTAEIADSVRASMEDQLPEGTWVKRIR